jgi:formate C-acetyltransferase
MTPRVQRLRQQSLDTRPFLSEERARLVTEAVRLAGAVAPPIQRAMVFRHLLEHKTIYIGDGELVVGERGPSPKAVPTFPELCCHSLDDLTVLDTRERISFGVSAEARRVYEEQVIPFWRGRSIRDAIFREMPDDWKAAYDAGVFTEFMEQRAPGHTVLGDVIYHKGFLDLIVDVDQAMAALDGDRDPRAYDKSLELGAMRIAAESIMRYAARHAAHARALAAAERDPDRRRELEEIAAVCDRVPAHAPETFREALQAYWFVHLGVVTERVHSRITALPRHQDPRQPDHRAALRDMDAGAVPLVIDRRLHRARHGLQRRRRALQHDLHHARRHRHGHRQPVGDSSSRLRDGGRHDARAGQRARP